MRFVKLRKGQKEKIVPYKKNRLKTILTSQDGMGGSRSYIDYRSADRVGNYLPDKHQGRGSIYFFHDTEECRFDTLTRVVRSVCFCLCCF